MSYTSVVLMAASGSLKQRITAAAAEHATPAPQQWAEQNIWTVVSIEPTWATNWDYSVETSTVNDNPDTGARNDVISDQMIKDAVFSVLASQGAVAGG